MKKWYFSKTLWVNVMAIAVIVAQGQFGYVVSADKQVAIMGIINFILRFATKEPII